MNGVVIAYGIDIRTCVWCGEGYVSLRLGKRPRSTCGPKCAAENSRYVRAEATRQWMTRRRSTRIGAKP